MLLAFVVMRSMYSFSSNKLLVVSHGTILRCNHSSDVVQFERIAIFPTRTQITVGLVHIFLVISSRADERLRTSHGALEPSRTDEVLWRISALTLRAVESRRTETCFANQSNTIAEVTRSARTTVCFLGVS